MEFTSNCIFSCKYSFFFFFKKKLSATVINNVQGTFVTALQQSNGKTPIETYGEAKLQGYPRKIP